MTIRDVLWVLRRRWYVCAVVLVVTAVAGLLTEHPGHTYRAAEVIAAEAPPSHQFQNKLTDMRPALATTSALVAQWMKGPDGTSKLRAAGVSGNYDVVPRNSGTAEMPAYSIPSVELSVVTSNPQTALTTVAGLRKVFDAQLVDLQDQQNVPVSVRITTTTLAQPSAVPVLNHKSRALIAVGLLGFAAMILLSLWYDAAALYFKARRMPELRFTGLRQLRLPGRG